MARETTSIRFGRSLAGHHRRLLLAVTILLCRTSLDDGRETVYAQGGATGGGPLQGWPDTSTSAATSEAVVGGANHLAQGVVPPSPASRLHNFLGEPAGADATAGSSSGGEARERLGPDLLDQAREAAGTEDASGDASSGGGAAPVRRSGAQLGSQLPVGAHTLLLPEEGENENGSELEGEGEGQGKVDGEGEGEGEVEGEGEGEGGTGEGVREAARGVEFPIDERKLLLAEEGAGDGRSGEGVREVGGGADFPLKADELSQQPEEGGGKGEGEGEGGGGRELVRGILMSGGEGGRKKGREGEEMGQEGTPASGGSRGRSTGEDIGIRGGREHCGREQEKCGGSGHGRIGGGGGDPDSQEGAVADDDERRQVVAFAGSEAGGGGRGGGPGGVGTEAAGRAGGAGEGAQDAGVGGGEGRRRHLKERKLRGSRGKRARTARGGNRWNMGRAGDGLENLLQYARTNARRLADVGACWSKAEQHLYRRTPGIEPSRALLARLESFEEMQRACTSGVDSWTEFLWGRGGLARQQQEDASGDSSGGASNGRGVGGTTPRFDLAKCQYLVPECSTGVGNHLLTLVSAFTFALLTNRALLLPPSNMREMLCNPFPGASWQLPPELQPVVGAQQYSGARLSNLTRGADRDGHLAEAPRIAIAYHRWNYGPAEQAFYCEVGQQALAKVPWLVFHSDQYSLPGLYLLDAFRDELERLFPDRRPFTHVSRYLLHPRNALWERITRLQRVYFRGCARRVGVQVRTFVDSDEYATTRVMECAVNVSAVLPPVIPSDYWQALLSSPSPSSSSAAAATPGHDLPGGATGRAPDLVRRTLSAHAPALVGVFVTSLHAHHFEHIRRLYAEGMAADGSLVAVHSAGSEGREAHDLERDERALSEMWLLSFSDALLTSDVSTFGYTAAGLAGLRPYLMNNARDPNPFQISFERNGRPVCDLAPSSEPCFHFPPRGRMCGGGGAKSPQPEDVLPFLRRCQDYVQGVRLMPKAA